MSKTALLKLPLIALIFALGGEVSLACMYGPPYRTVCETYAQADSVIVGKIESVEGDDSTQTVVIKVERTYKGQKRKEVVLSQPQSTCDFDFSGEVGRTLLLYLVRNQKTMKYSAIAGGMGGRVETQSDDIYWLSGLPGSLNRTRLSGAIGIYQRDPFEFLESVAGARVRIYNSKNSFEVLTDRNGVYELWDVPAGKYRIDPLLPRDVRFMFFLERGLVDFGLVNKSAPDTRDVLIEIQPKGCGGIDYIVAKTVARTMPDKRLHTDASIASLSRSYPGGRVGCCALGAAQFPASDASDFDNE